jgi:hypothetical protein
VNGKRRATVHLKTVGSKVVGAYVICQSRHKEVRTDREVWRKIEKVGGGFIEE